MIQEIEGGSQTDTQRSAKNTDWKEGAEWPAGGGQASMHAGLTISSFYRIVGIRKGGKK